MQQQDSSHDPTVHSQERVLKAETTGDPTKRKMLTFLAGHKHITLPEKVWCYGSLSFMLLFSLSLALILDASLVAILLGFSPIFATILFSLVIIESSHGKFRLAAWVLPVIFSVSFYITKDAPYTQGMDIPALSAFNFMLALFFVVVLSLVHDLLEMLDRLSSRLLGKESRAEQVRTFTKRKRQVEQDVLRHHNLPRPRRLREYVRSLEDKSKALNAVIGRVYNTSKGGHAAMRKRIQVHSQWYNEYSALDHDRETPEQLETARTLLGLIQKRLVLMQKTESEVFREDAKTLHNLRRDKDGNSRIIDVLIWNDKDPVEQYYRGAVQVVHQALDELE